MLFDASSYTDDPARLEIARHYLQDETENVAELIKFLAQSDYEPRHVQNQARELVEDIRKKLDTQSGLDALLHEYDLSSREGVMLMCLAEALLRIPDSDTADKLIKDKFSQSSWQQHLGKNDSLFVNASTWGLMLSGTLVNLDDISRNTPYQFFAQVLTRSGAPVIRAALKEAMRILGKMFIAGHDIDTALDGIKIQQTRVERYSFDMLGESAHTVEDAQRYYLAYQYAIERIAQHTGNNEGNKNSGNNLSGLNTVENLPGISVKLTALHPRFELAQREQVLNELMPMLANLCQLAADANIGLTIDAEEASRLDLTLDVFHKLLYQHIDKNWRGLGIAVQAYQKRALLVIKWLIKQARQSGKRICIRLVKGAYWDTEIKQAQQTGLPAYPVYTRKLSTDLSYLCCAKHLLDSRDFVYPQFATHNAHTASAILQLAQDTHGYEFQRLHGMGENLYKAMSESPSGKQEKIPACRVYAPVGKHADLLPYLVRRLLENGANTSFINRIEDPLTPVEQLITDPLSSLQKTKVIPNPQIPLPVNLFMPDRKNSIGFNTDNPVEISELGAAIQLARNNNPVSGPFINGSVNSSKPRNIISPHNSKHVVGRVTMSTIDDIKRALMASVDDEQAVSTDWASMPVEARAKTIERAAELFEQNKAELYQLIIDEAGRSLPDAINEVREAIDYCNYYAQQARSLLRPQALVGPTGEDNILDYHPRGTVLCISPWNFPLAIYAGQIIAALVCGNKVIAKPASQTPLIAIRVAELLIEAGVPATVLSVLPGNSKEIGPALLEDERVSGILFTGSTASAQTIQKTLAQRPGAIIPFIAETGGINCMLADSSALPEQIITDVTASAFNNAGQRCSALRVLFIQEDIYTRVTQLLKGSMALLHTGDPARLDTDVGPVIDQTAFKKLTDYIYSMKKSGRCIAEAPYTEPHEQGYFIAPVVFQLESLEELKDEIFGPVLHVIKYRADELDRIISDINNSQYGLTLGIHSRIQSTIDKISSSVNVGNIYVNRNMIGAVVGVQPFGGEGLSGTGPKAGGPHYLPRLVTERVISTNTAAIGGNASLLSLREVDK